MTIVGARPEFIQLLPVMRAIRRRHRHVLVHTGQHYDDKMSAVFFHELDIPKPGHHLGVGAGSHGYQTGKILTEVENVMLDERPDWVLVFGDTNSTVAGALASAKLHIPLAHIEAGLRSYDRRMPEEVNRIVTDHLSQCLLAPTAVAVENLEREGITRGVHQVGDVRVDLLRDFVPKARERRAALLERIGITEGEVFALATIHRASNTDDRERLTQVLEALRQVEVSVVLPVHPRLAKMMGEFGFCFSPNVRALEPLGFLELLALLDACAFVLTDSGGLQKEAYMLRRPCITLRDTTEWVETVDSGWNRLAEPTADSLGPALTAARAAPPKDHPAHYGIYGVGERIVDRLECSG
jgi:UDP-N-acetylglucosamine 2-epimerase